MKKRLLSLLLCLALCATLLPASAQVPETAGAAALEIPVEESVASGEGLSVDSQVEPMAELPSETISGYCGGEGDGTNLTWTLTPEGVLTISGKGKMEDYETGAAPWYGYRTLLVTLVLGEGITHIGNRAFRSCTGFKGQLRIPSSVITIGDAAFYACTGFNGSLNFPEAVTTIGSSAFGSCAGLSGDLVIPDSVSSIGTNAFDNCKGFQGKLFLSKNITSIPMSAFTNCKFSGQLIIPDGVTAIGARAFQSCSKFTGDLVIPEGVTEIGDHAFSHCRGFDGVLTLPKGLKKIGQYSFEECSGFTGDLLIPDGVTNINRYAFSGCTGFDGNLWISNSVLRINEFAFSGCTGLSGSLHLSEKLHVIEEAAFSGCSGLTGTLDLPNSLTEVGDSAFNGCTGLTGSVFIPEGLTKLSTGLFGSFSDITDIYFYGDAPTGILDASYSYNATFSSKATLHCLEGTSGWFDSSSYNAEKGTWKGYKLATWEFRPVWSFATDSFSFGNSYDAFGKGPYYVKQEQLGAWLANLSDSDQLLIAKSYAKRHWYDSFNLLLSDTLIERLKDNDLADFEGSCMGMSFAMALFRTEALQTELFSNAGNTKNIPAMNKESNGDVESFINILQMSQCLQYMRDTNLFWDVSDDDFAGNMEELWNYASSIDAEHVENLFLFCLSSHCVVCYGAEQGKWSVDGVEYTRRFLIADPNDYTGPCYVYVTESFDSAVYAQSWSTEYNPTGFGCRNIDLNSALLDTLGLSNVFGNTKQQNFGIQSLSVAQEDEAEKLFTINFYGSHSCTISSDAGSAVLQNGTVISDALGIQVVGSSNETTGGSSYTSSVSVTLPYGADYVVTPDAGTSIDMVANYGGFLYSVSGVLNSASFGADRVLTVSGNGKALNIDVVNDAGMFDFVSLSGKTESDITVKTDAEHQIQVSGEWETCTASHMERDLNKVSMDVSGNEDLLLSLDESDNLVVFSDEDNDGTYETEVQTPLRVTVLADQGKAMIQSSLPTNAGYLIIAQYDRNGKQLTTEYISVGDAQLFEKAITLVEGAKSFKAFVLDDAFCPLQEAVVESV